MTERESNLKKQDYFRRGVNAVRLLDQKRVKLKEARLLGRRGVKAVRLLSRKRMKE